MPSALSSTILRKLRHQRRLFQRYGVKKLEIFGSVARGEAKRGSDVDVIATFSKNPGLRIVELHRELESSLGVPVDLLDAQSVAEMANPYRCDSINSSRLAVYER
jgi:predicted nucleotidyltransferase